MSTEKSNGGPFVTFREECEILRGRIAELEAEVSRLKTVPMKYRRMQFNAELQEQVAKLEAQLADHKKLLLLAKRAMEAFTDQEGNMPAKTGEFNDLKDALAGIDNSKLVEGMILCDAKPVAYQEGNPDGIWFVAFSINEKAPQVPLYAPRRTEK